MLDHMENVYTALALQNFRNIGTDKPSVTDERKSNLMFSNEIRNNFVVNHATFMKILTTLTFKSTFSNP